MLRSEGGKPRVVIENFQTTYARSSLSYEILLPNFWYSACLSRNKTSDVSFEERERELRPAYWDRKDGKNIFQITCASSGYIEIFFLSSEISAVWQNAVI